MELIESGWNMKHIHRLIVGSEAYRMSSSVRDREKELAIDPRIVAGGDEPDSTRVPSGARLHPVACRDTR